MCIRVSNIIITELEEDGKLSASTEKVVVVANRSTVAKGIAARSKRLAKSVKSMARNLGADYAAGEGSTGRCRP